MKTLILSTALALTSTAAFSQAQCGPRDAMLRMLEERYGETQLGLGLTGDGHALEVFVSPATNTFTVTTTGANGVSCIRAYGESFEVFTDFVKQEGELN